MSTLASVEYWKKHRMIRDAIQAALDCEYEGAELTALEIPFQGGIQVRVVKMYSRSVFILGIATVLNLDSLKDTVNTLWEKLHPKVREACSYIPKERTTVLW